MTGTGIHLGSMLVVGQRLTVLGQMLVSWLAQT